MINIYCIEDINGLCYVGSTKESLRRRFNRHKVKKNSNSKYSSSSRYLDLDNAEIIFLEECNNNKKERNEAEQYYIQNIKCVNAIKNLTGSNTIIYKNWKRSFGRHNNLQTIDPSIFL